jgi:leucyl aminopeptidase (aminopeptidase T)
LKAYRTVDIHTKMELPVDYSSLVSGILDDCLEVKPEDAVWISSWDYTLDLASALESGCVKRGCPHMMTVQFEDTWFRSISRLPNRQLQQVPPQMRAALAKTDCFIFTMGPRKPIPWNSIPKRKRGLVSIWLDTRYDKSPYAREWTKICKLHGVRVLAIEATLATPERAKALGLNYREWKEVMFQGCLADHREIARRSRGLAKVLSGNGRVRISTPSGTELTFALDRRPVEVSDGMATKAKAKDSEVTFLPAGSVEVSVNEESAEGKVVYDAPVRIGNQTIQDLEIDLKDGDIHRHRAATGGDVFEQYLRGSGRDAGRFAFFGFGLNPKLRHGYTQDDKVLGGVTLGFGDNRTMGGRNQASQQWWASLTRAMVTVKGIKILDEGKLLV